MGRSAEECFRAEFLGGGARPEPCPHTQKKVNTDVIACFWATVKTMLHRVDFLGRLLSDGANLTLKIWRSEFLSAVGVRA
jgi:hypothetical protein